MKLSDFILLDEKKKMMAVLHQGVLIAKRNIPNSMVFLFQIESYYVETYCSMENKEVEEFRVFDNLESLTPYLEAIPIQHLFKRA